MLSLWVAHCVKARLFYFPRTWWLSQQRLPSERFAETCPMRLRWCRDANAIIVCLSPVTTELPPGSGHERRCNETEKGYCVNNGECYFIHGINQLSCKWVALPFSFPTVNLWSITRLCLDKGEAEHLFFMAFCTITHMYCISSLYTLSVPNECC